MALKNNTWKLNQWYDQSVAGNVSYSGVPILYALGGDNNYGQLGLNDKVLRSSPTQVPGTTWSQVGSGNYQTLATKTDNTLWGWGLNSQGQLGINDNVSYSSPVQVPGTIWSGPVNAGMNVSSVIAQL